MRTRIITSLLAISSVALSAPGAVSAAATSTPSAGITEPLAATQAVLRDLWIGHVFWVREVVVHLLARDDKAATVAEGEVVANAKRIAAAIQPFYGQAASDQLFRLLAGHYGAVKAHAEATIAGNAADAQKAIDQLTANAHEIAKFLSTANPNLPEATLVGLLAAHGGHHVQQNQQLAKHDLAGEARTWDAMKNHMYVIADALGGGIAKQFPEKFR